MFCQDVPGQASTAEEATTATEGQHTAGVHEETEEDRTALQGEDVGDRGLVQLRGEFSSSFIVSRPLNILLNKGRRSSSIWQSRAEDLCARKVYSDMLSAGDTLN